MIGAAQGCQTYVCNTCVFCLGAHRVTFFSFSSISKQQAERFTRRHTYNTEWRQIYQYVRVPTARTFTRRAGDSDR